MKFARAFVSVAGVAASLAGAWLSSCSSDDPISPGNEGGSAIDAGDASAADAPAPDGTGPDARPDGCAITTTEFDAGDTCAGFGAKSPCEPGCTPAYGYVCTGGGPPNLKGCVRVSESSFGGTYCCPDLACVRVTSQDKKCVSPQKALYHCLAAADGGLVAKPAAGCTEVVGDPDLPPIEARYFCCDK
jgi:hypothetical protein